MKCIFCDIAKGKMKSFKVYEDKKHLALLDINPNTEGMTLVITKKHYPSYIFSMPPYEYKEFFNAAKNVSKKLEKGLKVKRVALVVEGLAVNHAHIKLYPLHGLEKKFVPTLAKKRIFFKKYEGYISTQLGSKASEKQLEKLAEKIRRV